MYLANHYAVPGDGVPFYINLQVGLAYDPVGNYSARLYTGNLLEKALDFQANPIDCVEVRPLYLDAHRRAHTTLEHHYSCGDRLELGRTSGAGDLACFDNFIPYIIRCFNFVPPLADSFSVFVGYYSPIFVGFIFRFVIDNRLYH